MASLGTPSKVTVYIENEFLRRRVDDLLSGVSSVSDTKFCADPAKLAHLALQQPADVVMVSSSNRARFQSKANGRPAPLTLMLLDDAQILGGVDVASYTADGYLVLADLTCESLAEALRLLKVGQMPLPLNVGRTLLGRALSPQPAMRPTPLTAREMDTLQLLVMGLSNKQIGRRLRISEHGAKRLVGSVLMKLGAINRTEAVVIAIRKGLAQDFD